MGDRMGIFSILTEVIEEANEGFNGWCGQEGVRNAFSMIGNVLTVMRIVVPIGLIVMTSLDVAKKVINPEEKDGQKKIINRAIAALVVFLIPTFISIVFKIIDYGSEVSSGYSENESKSNLSQCLDGGNWW